LIKTLGVQLSLFMREPQMRTNLVALWKYTLFLATVVTAYSVLFQVIMVQVEHQEHSWFSGLYWTLVTMTTVGFGDITFQTDLGRAFSVVVLFSGVVLLLIVFPFVLIRYLYAPWLESQMHLRAPRELSRDISGHVILCSYEDIAPSVITQLELHRIPYVVLEPDPEKATRLHTNGIRVIYGEIDSIDTFLRARAPEARLVVANLDDVTNTNVILTVREVAPKVRTAAICSSDDSIDLLQLAGADHVLPLRRRLGEQLAGRINAGHAQTHIIGTFRDLVLAEFPVLNTPLAGKRIRDTQLREALGVSIVGVWEQAVLAPAHPDRVLTEHCLPVVIGTREQMEELDELLYIYDTNWNPVIVIGGGKVGRSATRSLKDKGLTVHMVERNAVLAERWKELPHRMLVGEAANRELLVEAGIAEAPSVLLTTNDDAMNVYLAAYCRRLNPTLRIVSRVTHERNVQSIRRAGADLVLSYAGLGMESILSLARDRTLVLLSEGLELFEERIPPMLIGTTLADSAIGQRTGLIVVAIETEGRLSPAPRAQDTLSGSSQLYMIGAAEQHHEFRRIYGQALAQEVAP